MILSIYLEKLRFGDIRSRKKKLNRLCFRKKFIFILIYFENVCNSFLNYVF